MRPSRGLRRLAAAAAAATFAAAPASAQLRIDAELAINSAFVWRGVTSTNRIVIDPTLELSTPLRGSTLAVGAWGNFEPSRYDGASDLTPLEGAAGPALTMSQLWLELERPFGALTVSLGLTRYLYPDVGDLASRYTTTEVYAEGTLDGAPLAPMLSIAHDVGTVRGTYLELGLSRDVAIPLSRTARWPLALSAAVGWSAGQAEAPQGDAGYFAADGLTHAELGASSAFAIRGIGIEPSAHVVLARDEWARVVAPDESRRVKAWFGVAVTWSGSVGGRESR